MPASDQKGCRKIFSELSPRRTYEINCADVADSASHVDFVDASFSNHAPAVAKPSDPHTQIEMVENTFAMVGDKIVK
jgi:hypothetical protein